MRQLRSLKLSPVCVANRFERKPCFIERRLQIDERLRIEGVAVEPDHGAILATGAPRTPIKPAVSGIRVRQFSLGAGNVAANNVSRAAASCHRAA